MCVVTTAVIGGLALGAYGANQMNKGSRSAAAAAGDGRSYEGEAQETLQSRLKMAPDIFAAESSQEYGQPAYARMETDIIREQFPALLDIYEQNQPRVAALEEEARASARQADVSDVQRYGPQMAEAFRKANPDLFRQLEMVERAANDGGPTAIEQKLEAEALRKMAEGGTLSAEELYRADQDVRGAFQSRGRNQGNAAITSEVLNRYGLRRDRENQNFGFAMDANRMLRAGQDADRNFQAQAVGLRAGATIDPAMAVLGRQSTATGATQAMAGQAGQRGGPGWFDPWSDPYAADLYNTNYNAQFAARTNAANIQAARGAGLMQMGGSIFSAGMGGMG